MNYEIVLATTNKHKLQEVRQILSPHKIVVYGLNDLGLKVEDVEENGKTYAENALIKAKAVQKVTSFPVIADDSGLEIIPLGNRPGMFSARYAAEMGGHDKAIAQILEDLKDKDDRSAQFVCDRVALATIRSSLVMKLRLALVRWNKHKKTRSVTVLKLLRNY